MNRYFLIIYIFLCLYFPSNGQTIGDYRNAIQNGNWNEASTWETYNGTTWVAATQKPALNDDVYLNFDAQVNLTQTESCRNLYLNGDAGTNAVLLLADFTLEVFGTLNAFTGSAPGLPSSVNIGSGWIQGNPTGAILIKGSSRDLNNSAGAWSAGTNHAYRLLIGLDPGQTVTLLTNIKVGELRLISGRLNAGNNNIGAQDLTIQSGAILQSNSGTIAALNAGGTGVGNSFTLEAGGTFDIDALNPSIEYSQVILQGTVRYTRDEKQNSLNEISLGVSPNLYEGDLVNVFGRELELRDDIVLQGDFIGAAGTFLSGTFRLSLTGNRNQQLTNLNAPRLTIDKSTGNTTLLTNLTITNNLTLNAGILNLNNFQLNLGNNTSLTAISGRINTNGTVRKTYANGENLTITIPFWVGPYNRSIRINGASFLSSGNAFTFSHTLSETVNNVSFLDGLATIRRVNTSAWNIVREGSSLLTGASLSLTAGGMDIASADQIRITRLNSSAPGSNTVGSLIGGDFVANRTGISLNNLSGNFYVSSTNTNSTLPVELVYLQAVQVENSVQLKWQTASEENNSHFEIERSIGSAMNFEQIGLIEGNGTIETPQTYQYIDDVVPVKNQNLYYRLKQIDYDGSYEFSPVVKASIDYKAKTETSWAVYPNPYRQGRLSITLLDPSLLTHDQHTFSLHNMYGELKVKVKDSISRGASSIESFLVTAPKGIYILQIKSGQQIQSFRLIRD